jgi:hypothetical protein
MGVSGMSGLSGPGNFYTKYFSFPKLVTLKNFSREKFRANFFSNPKNPALKFFRCKKIRF